MSNYYYLTLDVVMRDCHSAQDAVVKLNQLMPENPDETTTYMESWAIEKIRNPEIASKREQYDRSDRLNEIRLENLINRAEGKQANAI